MVHEIFFWQTYVSEYYSCWQSFKNIQVSVGAQSTSYKLVSVQYLQTDWVSVSFVLLCSYNLNYLVFLEKLISCWGYAIDYFLKVLSNLPSGLWDIFLTVQTTKHTVTGKNIICLQLFFWWQMSKSQSYFWILFRRPHKHPFTK